MPIQKQETEVVEVYDRAIIASAAQDEDDNEGEIDEVTVTNILPALIVS